MSTRLWVVKSVLFHAPPWQLCQGKRWSTKGSLLLPPAICLSGGRLGGGRFLFTRPRFVIVLIAAAVDVASSVATSVAAAASVVAAAAAASGGGGCGAAFFPGFVAFEDFLPRELWS